MKEAFNLFAFDKTQSSMKTKTNNKIIWFIIEYDEVFTADCGVPQGSHIGPLLFILFTADIVRCTEGTGTNSSLYDSNMLQKAVDNLVEWSRANLLDLNAAKTQHVTYRGRRTITYSSIVYIGGLPVAKSATVRDLGVSFDSHMNFGYHIEQITSPVKSIYGLGYRFVKEINCPQLILRIFDTYAVPILEYCSLIWNRNLIGVAHQIEQIHHKVTRLALGTPYRTDAIGYKPFPERVRALNRNTLAERRIISSIIYVHKLLNGQIESKLAAYLRTFLVLNIRHTRNPNIFDISNREITTNSSLRLAMLQVNTYRNHIAISESENLTKAKMKRLLLLQAVDV